MKSFIHFCLILSFTMINTDSKAQWMSLNSGTSQDLKAIHFTDAVTGYAAGSSGILLKTTNSGVNWIIQSSGTSLSLNSMHFFNALTGIACGNTGVIIRTTNGGLNWIVLSSGVTDHLLGISFADNMNGICSGNNGDLLRSTNGGVSWTVSVTGFLVTYFCSHMITASTGYAAGVNTIFQPFVARTSNGGVNWTYSSFYINGNEGIVRGIHFRTADDGFAACNIWNGQGSVSRTTNSGLNWVSQIFTFALNDIFFTDTSTGYAVGFNGQILKTTNGGSSWFTQISGISAPLRSVFFIGPLTGYTTGDAGIILKTTNGGITSVKEAGGITFLYNLSQNYPNPFNNSTKIKFSIRAAGTVIITLYDIIGRELSTVADNMLQPGNYEVLFNGEGYTSGMYLYEISLSSGTEMLFRDRKKMILIK